MEKSLIQRLIDAGHAPKEAEEAFLQFEAAGDLTSFEYYVITQEAIAQIP